MKRFYIAVICAAAISGSMIIMSLPVFSVSSEKVSVTGLYKLSAQEALNAAGLSRRVNFFGISAAKAERNLAENPYVLSAEVTKTLPNTVSVKIKERRLCGYISDGGNYVYIDPTGMVLDIKENFTELLPVIVGLKYNSYSKGKILETENENIFKTVVQFAGLFDDYELGHDIISVDINNEEDIRLFVHDIEVKMGGTADLSYKIRYLKAALPEIKDKKGILDLTPVSKSEPARFRILT